MSSIGVKHDFTFVLYHNRERSTDPLIFFSVSLHYYFQLSSLQQTRSPLRDLDRMGPVGKTERHNLNSGLSALSTSAISLWRSLRAVVTLTNHMLW